ncbi:MAG TPA: hypothetical protein VFY10_10100 [Dehalococcoidia bacterium]|nr:hypothetical protein [Dehalococcoidia bacterium]
MRQITGWTLHSTTGKVLLPIGVLIVAVLVGYGVMLATQGSSSNGTTNVPVGSFGNVTQPALDTAVAGLCAARDDFQLGDEPAARQVFYDKSHLVLHQLAAQVQDKDVNTATNLLLAMYFVENVIPPQGQTPVPVTGPEKDLPAPELVSRLLAQVQQSAALIGFQASNCTQ